MSIDVTWYTHPPVNSGTAIMFAMRDPWDWDEFEAGVEILKQMANEAGEEIAVVIDLSQTERAPSQMILHMRRALNTDRPEASMVLLVGMNWFFRVMSDAISMAFPQHIRRMRTFTTMDEVHAFLARIPTKAGPA